RRGRDLHRRPHAREAGKSHPLTGRGTRHPQPSRLRTPHSTERPTMSPHSTATFGTNAVDWENRISFDRLRTERMARLRAELECSDLGALLAFDFANIRYMSATPIGTWAMDKLIPF